MSGQLRSESITFGLFFEIYTSETAQIGSLTENVNSALFIFKPQHVKVYKLSVVFGEL